MIDEDLPPEPRKVTLTFRTMRNFALLLVAATGAAALVTVAVVALLVSIFEHKQEARNPFVRVVEIKQDTVDPEIWGKNFPLEYDRYKLTSQSKRTRYGGSEAVPRIATPDDPRAEVTKSKLELDPRLVTMWAGYSFALDYRQKRGHAYMLDDQTFTGRQKVAQPGTCLNCHASAVMIYKQLGGDDIFKGFDALNHMPYADARKLAKHPVACIDCHDPETMALRVTRPAFMEGIAAFKESQGQHNYDVNRDASRQEMRAYVCGQCHVEYYFKGPEKRLTFPWFKGLQGDQILAYYDETGFKDWTHADTGAPCLKAQHPEFETWNQGIHARSGVACADCHMPYMRVGAQKISDHNVRSPLLNIAGACQTCHHQTEDEIRSRVELIQSKNTEMSNRALDALMDLIAAIKTDCRTAAAGSLQKARAEGASEATLEKARSIIDLDPALVKPPPTAAAVAGVAGAAGATTGTVTAAPGTAAAAPDRAVEAVLEKARAALAADPAIQKARDFQRKAEFLIDFVIAENSTGFHAPQESARLLLTALDYSRMGLQALSSPDAKASPVAAVK
jgi:nitrite reductase (cytochrome c-552)